MNESKPIGKYNLRVCLRKCRGLILVLSYEQAMNAATQNFPFVCAAITSYREPPQDLEQLFGQAVHFYAERVKQQTNWL